MKWKLLVMGAVILVLAGCNPVLACGDFTFTGTEVDTSSSNGIDMNVSFDFDPSVCSSTCYCDEVVYIQIVRTYDLSNATYLYPSTEKMNRATADGYYLDRLAGKIWGYYGRNDDGTFASSLTPGSNTSDAILFDSPRRPESEPWLGIWWQAVSVPVCIDTSSGCSNNLLGYYFWSWLVNDSGDVTGIVDWTATSPQADSVDDAVVEWNSQAPGLGKNTFPTFTDLTP